MTTIRIISVLGTLATAGMIVVILSGKEVPRSEMVSKQERSVRKVGGTSMSSWIPAAFRRAGILPVSHPESLFSLRIESSEEDETNLRVAEPPKEIARTVRLADLPVSPQFLRRLEAETGEAGTSVTLPPALPFSGRGGGTQEDPVDPNALPPDSYRLEAFFPGKTGSGRPIDPSPDPDSLQSAVSFPPDYSLATTDPLKNRLLSLGHGGIVVFEIVGGYLVDGPGPDFVVFENPFVVNGTNGREVYAETAVVSVAEEDSDDSYRSFPCAKDEPPYRGCAGVVPVRYAAGLPLDEVGGDLFDLADLGVSRARFLRIRDTGDNRSYLEGTEGFDLDGIALLHAVKENP